MIYCRVDGKAVSQACHPSLRGWPLLVCQPVTEDGAAVGHPLVAVDPLGAGLYSRVLVSTDGIGCRERVRDPRSPLRNFIQGIVDE